MATTIASTKSCSLSTFRIETTSRRTGQRTPPLLSLEDFFGKVNLELTNLTINEIHRNFQRPTASVLGIHGGACTLIRQRQGLQIEKAAMIGRNKITEWRAPKWNSRKLVKLVFWTYSHIFTEWSGWVPGWWICSNKSPTSGIRNLPTSTPSLEGAVANEEAGNS